LSCKLRDKIEVVLSHVVLVLDHARVNQRPRRRVLKAPLSVLDEETLSDALVHNDDSDEGLLLGRVVGLIDGLPELVDLLLEDLFPHGITHSVSVDDEVLWIITMSLLEAPKRTLDGVFQLLVDNLLSLALHDALRVVLAARLVH
jgi:hypothetical protein